MIGHISKGQGTSVVACVRRLGFIFFGQREAAWIEDSELHARYDAQWQASSTKAGMHQPWQVRFGMVILASNNHRKHQPSPQCLRKMISPIDKHPRWGEVFMDIRIDHCICISLIWIGRGLITLVVTFAYHSVPVKIDLLGSTFACTQWVVGITHWLPTSVVACTHHSANVRSGLPTSFVACTHRHVDVEHVLQTFLFRNTLV